MSEAIPGKKYRHFKGDKYVVLHIGYLTNVFTPVVVYRGADEPHEIWVRSKDEFEGEIDGKTRFELEETQSPIAQADDLQKRIVDCHAIAHKFYTSMAHVVTLDPMEAAVSFAALCLAHSEKLFRKAQLTKEGNDV